MSEVTRRRFGQLAGGTSLVAAQPLLFNSFALAQGAPKIVIVGGGPGGATVAHHLKAGDPNLDVTLVEVQPTFTTCFFSNLYLGGFRTFKSITHD